MVFSGISILLTVTSLNIYHRPRDMSSQSCGFNDKVKQGQQAGEDGTNNESMDERHTRNSAELSRKLDRIFFVFMTITLTGLLVLTTSLLI